jgi:holo-[acyl-carrier protein] synthase
MDCPIRGVRLPRTTPHRPERYRLVWAVRGPGSMPTMAILVGLDLVAVANVADSLRAAHGDRYLERLFTEREIADCRTAAGIDAERLAARFAAKEATLKVLPAADEGVSWQDIEVRREPSGRVSLELRGRGAELAAAAAIVDFSLSITHESGFAAAVVVARSRDEPLHG